MASHDVHSPMCSITWSVRKLSRITAFSMHWTVTYSLIAQLMALSLNEKPNLHKLCWIVEYPLSNAGHCIGFLYTQKTTSLRLSSDNYDLDFLVAIMESANPILLLSIFSSFFSGRAAGTARLFDGQHIMACSPLTTSHKGLMHFCRT